MVPTARQTDAQAALDALAPAERLRWKSVRVSSGDTLGGLAHRYHTDIDVLRRANGLRGNLIREGQDLMIPTTANPSVAPPNRRSGAPYTVKPGDSLWEIARATNTTVAALKKTNRLSRNEPIRVGQTLTIPGSGRSVARTIHYKVRSGDSLARIAGRFGVSIDEITVWNGLDRTAYLHPGQKLRLTVPVAGR